MGDQFPSVVILAWTRISARQEDLAAQLSGEVKIVYPDHRMADNGVVRYLISAGQTISYLWRGRYDVLIVTAPPVETALLCAVFGRQAKPLVLDSHPGAFGLSGDTHSGMLQRAHRWLWRQAAFVMVTTPELAAMVDAAGGRGMVFHEPPPEWDRGQPGPAAGVTDRTAARRTVCVPFIFTRDEPVDVLLAAARRLPDVEFRVTGDPARLPEGLDLPANVALIGFLDSGRFLDELAAADVVVVLSTEPQSVMRTAYEAIRLGRPLAVSDTTATREYFPFAEHCENAGGPLSSAIGRLLDESSPDRARRTDAAREYSDRTTAQQMAELRSRIAGARGRHREEGGTFRPRRRLPGRPVPDPHSPAVDRRSQFRP